MWVSDAFFIFFGERNGLLGSGTVAVHIEHRGSGSLFSSPFSPSRYFGNILNAPHDDINFVGALASGGILGAAIISRPSGGVIVGHGTALGIVTFDRDVIPEKLIVGHHGLASVLGMTMSHGPHLG